MVNIQCVALATEPSISLIVLTPMLQFEQEYVRCVRNEEESSLNEEPLYSEKMGVWCEMS